MLLPSGTASRNAMRCSPVTMRHRVLSICWGKMCIRDRVNRALEAACNTYLPEESEVCRAARYSLMRGGKRIRAVLVLSVCDMLHGNAEAAEQFAAAVEMLHCYSRFVRKTGFGSCRRKLL